jgi:hypothetical protein
MSASNPELSIYHPLRNGSDEIRLITIEPSPELSDAICCSIETVELSSTQEYFALSYAWGDAGIIEEIKVGETPISVTTNLAAALRRLRYSAESIRFWIDSICINQASVSEKNHQIPLMRMIYSQAKGVVVWLDEEGNDSELAISLIKRWRDGIIGITEDCPEESRTSPLKALLSRIENPFDKQSMRAVDCLLRRSYRNRIWVIQEIVLAKGRLILCGGDSIHHPDLSLVLRFLD